MTVTITLPARRRRLRALPTAASPADQQLWDVKRCCEYLGGIDPHTLWVWRRNLGLPTIEIPGTNRILFAPASIQAWVMRHESTIAAVSAEVA